MPSQRQYFALSGLFLKKHGAYRAEISIGRMDFIGC